MRKSIRVVVLLLLACSALPPCCAKKARGLRQRAKRQERKLRSGNNLGNWVEATEPMHKNVCGDHVCRPGEGNLKGYEHWKQPYESKPLGGLSKYPAHDWSRGAAFPDDKYASLVAAARSAVPGGSSFIALTVADFDFRLLAENWYTAAKAVATPALVHALDSDVFSYLTARGVPAHNGTANLQAWESTKLQRHIQRALAERHMAAAALVSAGFDVMMCDTTHVLRRSAEPFFRAQPAQVDLFAPRGNCNARKERAGCGARWNFMLMRGSSAAARPRVLKFVQSAMDTGMIDFYLRWWAGHHCIFMGYEKLFRTAPLELEAPATAALNAEQPNATAVIRLKGKLCTGGDCLRLGQLPANLFPAPGAYPTFQSEAMVGRTNRPDKDPKRSHRLRLDRYDETDFDNLKEAMTAEGLWLLR